MSKVNKERKKKQINYNPFPEDTIGAESWLLFKAREMGLHVKVVPEARFIHLRPYGHESVWTNGQSAYVNGYPFVVLLLRVAWHILSSPSDLKQFGMVGGFIQYWVRQEPKLDTARFAFQWEVERLRRLILK